MSSSYLKLRNITLIGTLLVSIIVLGKGKSIEAGYNQIIETDSVYVIVDKMPEFPGGNNAMIQFIGRNITYPVDAQMKYEEGRVIVQFVIDKTGHLTGSRVLKSVSPSIDKEALRVINSFPNWIPGEQNGEKVAVYQVVPVTFKQTQLINESDIWVPSNETLVVIDSLKMPINFNLDVLDVDRVDTFMVLKPFPPKYKRELIKQYGPLAKNGVILIKSLLDNQFKLSNSDQSKPEDENYVYRHAEKMPVFPDGETKLYSLILKNMRYPVIAQENGIQGKVVVRFIIDKTGKVKEAKVIKGVDTSLDEEALRVITSLPNWIPGENHGNKVNVYYTLPLTFRLDEGKDSNLENENSIIVLDGKRLPLGFNLNLLRLDRMISYKSYIPTFQTKNKFIKLYGKEAVNGVLELISKRDQSSSKEY